MVFIQILLLILVIELGFIAKFFINYFSTEFNKRFETISKEHQGIYDLLTVILSTKTPEELKRANKKIKESLP